MFNTFILKVANRCNIDCDYCYVFNSADLKAHDLPARMGVDVVRATADRIEQYATSHGLPTVNVVLHGGEPLLLGPAGMDAMLHLIAQRLEGSAANYTVQTNGTLLSDRWLDLFDEHGVRVGVSLDGPPSANDRHRLTVRGDSTAAAVVDGLRLLQSRPRLFAGILAVIDLLNDPIEVFDCLAAFAPPVLDFALPHANHAAPPLRPADGGPQYGHWLGRLYDHWISSGREDVTIRMFDDVIGLTLGAKGSVEALGLAEAGSITIESDGSIETIDALRTTTAGETDLGLDVFRHTFDDAEVHPRVVHRRNGKAALSSTCRACALVDVCGGGYLPHRFHPVTGYDNPSVYCPDLMYLISHIQASVSTIANDMTTQNDLLASVEITRPQDEKSTV